MTDSFLNDNPLFYGIPNISDTLARVNAREVTYVKGDVLIAEQTKVENIGIILKGEAQASTLEPSGRRFILTRLASGRIFGDVLAASSNQKSPVTVIAAADTTALLIPFKNIVSLRTADNRLLLNLFNVISGEYFELQERINCLIKPTLREKILFYLNSVSERERGKTFLTPFSRAGLADYLNAERSALSRELSAMKKDGLIDYYKSTFKLL